MSTPRRGYINYYINGQPPSASDLNHRASMGENDALGALYGLGAGVLDGLEVTRTNGVYSVSAGGALVPHDSYGLVPVRILDSEPVDSPDAGKAFLFVSLPINPDPRETGAPLFVWDAGAELDGALLLAEIAADGTITDRRQFSQIPTALARVTELEDRLDALENPSGTPEGGVSGETPDPTATVSRAEYNTLVNRFNDLTATLADLQAIIQAPGTTTQTRTIDRYLHRDVAELEIEAARNRPQFTLEADASLVNPGADSTVVLDNYGFGDGQIIGYDENGDLILARDVHSGNTNFDNAAGAES